MTRNAKIKFDLARERMHSVTAMQNSGVVFGKYGEVIFGVDISGDGFCPEQAIKTRRKINNSGDFSAGDHGEDGSLDGAVVAVE